MEANELPPFSPVLSCALSLESNTGISYGEEQDMYIQEFKISKKFIRSSNWWKTWEQGRLSSAFR